MFLEPSEAMARLHGFVTVTRTASVAHGGVARPRSLFFLPSNRWSAALASLLAGTMLPGEEGISCLAQIHATDHPKKLGKEKSRGIQTGRREGWF